MQYYELKFFNLYLVSVITYNSAWIVSWIESDRSTSRFVLSWCMKLSTLWASVAEVNPRIRTRGNRGKLWLKYKNRKFERILNEIMNEIMNFSDFLSPTKNLIPHVCGPQSSPSVIQWQRCPRDDILFLTFLTGSPKHSVVRMWKVLGQISPLPHKTISHILFNQNQNSFWLKYVQVVYNRTSTVNQGFNPSHAKDWANPPPPPPPCFSWITFVRMKLLKRNFD